MKQQFISLWNKVIFIAVFMWFIISCGIIETPKLKKGSYSDEDMEGEAFRAVSIPSEYYESILKTEFENAQMYGVINTASTPLEQVFYINFDGGQIKKGFNKMESFLLCTQEAYIHKANLNITKDEISKILEELEQDLNSSNFAQNLKVKLVNKMPIAGNFSTIFVGGVYPDLGCESENPLIAIVPFDYGNLSDKDVGFIFTERTKINVERLKLLLQKVILNLLGLKEITEMIPSLTLPSNIELPATKEIHSFARLLWRLDSDSIIDLSSLENEIKQILPQGMKIPTGLDKIFTATLGVIVAKSQTPPVGSKILDILSKAFNSSALDANTVSAIAIIAGHPEIAAAAQILVPIAKNEIDKVKQGMKESDPSKKLKLPDYVALLGLNNINSMPELIAYFRGHFQYIKDNYTGSTFESLKALLIYTYSQKFRSLGSVI